MSISSRLRWMGVCALVSACAAPAPPPLKKADSPAKAPVETLKAGAERQAPPDIAPDVTSGEEAPVDADTAPAPLVAQPLQLPLVRPLVEQAIARRELPGCVVAVGTGDGLRYLEAFGQRSLDPPEPMTVDTLFDLASVTKVLATTLSLMRLEEQGKLDVNARVARYLPQFAQRGKRDVRVHHLLTHTSGLPRVNALAAYDDGPETAFARIYALPLEHPIGQVFNYSDLGFLVLGKLVEKLSGQPLHEFAHEQVYEPLGLARTRFLPPESELPLAAPTEERDDQTIRGVVDDPRSYRLGGVAGNAGLFSDAREVSRIAQLLLNEGELDGARVFEPETVRRWTRPQRAGHAKRTLGWDSDSGYARGRGVLMGARTFGHSGYTGASLWIDPERDAFVLLLSNRVHMGPDSTIYPLASSLADLSLLALAEDEKSSDETPRVLAGIDVLQQQAFAPLRGRKVALLTNGSARDRAGKRSLDILRDTNQLSLVTVWTPEHGLSARREGHVAGQRLGALRVHSLFGRRRDPTPGMLHGAEAIVVDLQDVGARFYTYAATVGRVLQFAAERELPVWILDRPNPLGGQRVQGPITQTAFESFVNHHPLPVQHGLTIGELARLLASERELDVPLSVVRLSGWRRDMLFGDTGLTWHAPSPNLRSIAQVMLYPAVALVEGTNVSVGRGTQAPFELVGAPFVDAEQLAHSLRESQLPGLRIEPVHFRPRAARHRGKLCHGVRLTLEDPARFDPMRTGLALARALGEFRPDWDDSRLANMIAHQPTLDQLAQGAPLGDIMSQWQADTQDFESRRAAALIYESGAPKEAAEVAGALQAAHLPSMDAESSTPE